MKLKPLSEQVMVITGASSGIGRACALAAAARGARVVAAARGQDALDTLAAEIGAAGGEAIAVVCDVTDEAQVNALAARAVEAFGRIDTWVNNAGVAMAVKLEDGDLADARRLFDVNVWGIVHGCRAALPHLKRNGGALINMGSFVADVAAGYMGIYSASKMAVKGFTDALRIELLIDRAPVSVTLIKPGPISTPVLEHQRNRLDRQATMPPPFHRPEDVARAVLYAAERGPRDLFVGSVARFGSIFGQVLPNVADHLAAAAGPHLFRRPEPRADRPDNLYEPSRAAAVHGDPHGRTPRPSVYTWARTHPAAGSLAALAGAGATLAGLVLGRRR